MLPQPGSEHATPNTCNDNASTKSRPLSYASSTSSSSPERFHDDIRSADDHSDDVQIKIRRTLELLESRTASVSSLPESSYSYTP
jgi:hypothetical protein